MTATAHVEGVILARDNTTTVLLSWIEVEAIAKARHEWAEAERKALDAA